jgi:hypothetical protein
VPIILTLWPQKLVALFTISRGGSLCYGSFSVLTLNLGLMGVASNAHLYTVPFRPTLRSQVTRPFEKKSWLICHKSPWQPKRWTEISSACGAVAVTNCHNPESTAKEMSNVQQLTQDIKENLISSWRSQVTMAEE